MPEEVFKNPLDVEPTKDEGMALGNPIVDPNAKRIFQLQVAIPYSSVDPTTMPNPNLDGYRTMYSGNLYIFSNGGWKIFYNFPVDPNADRIPFWDDSAGAIAWLTLSGASISGTTLTVSTGRGSLMVVIPSGDTWTVGDGKIYIDFGPLLNGMNLTYARCVATTAGTTGTSVVSIYNMTDSADVLSTQITIDSGETGSETAATPYVIDTAHDEVATNDRWEINIDSVSTTPPKGLNVILEFATP